MLSIVEYLVTTLRSLLGVTSIKSQKGVTMIEYALIAALITIVVIATLALIGPELNTTFQTILTEIQTANS